MAVGRSIADLRGTINLGGHQVITQWKGIVVARSTPLTIAQPRTPLQVKHRMIMAELRGRWFGVLTELQRAKWEANAKMLGSAYDQEKAIVSSGSGNIIPRGYGKLMGGVHLYTRCNVLAASSGLPYPRDEAPLSTGNPPAPILERAYLDKDEEGKPIVICEIAPINLEGYPEKKVRVWMDVLSQGMKRTAVIESVLNVPEPPVIKLAFKGFRAHKNWGKEFVSFSELNNGRVRIQCDVVGTYSPAHGVVRSANSALGEVALPLQNNPDAEAMTKHIREYKGRIMKAFLYRKQALKILSDKLGKKLMAGENAGDAIAEILK